MPCIVVLAGGEGIEATSEVVYGRMKDDAVINGEVDVETAIKNRGRKFVEATAHKSQANEVALGALQRGQLRYVGRYLG